MSYYPVTLNKATSLFVAGLDKEITNEMLVSFFSDLGYDVKVEMPARSEDFIIIEHFAYVEFKTVEEANEAVAWNLAKLNGKQILIHKPGVQLDGFDVGADLRIENLHPEISEDELYNAFSPYGAMMQFPKLTENFTGFVHFASFDVADAVILAMDGKCLRDRAIKVSYVDLQFRMTVLDVLRKFTQVENK